MQVYFMYLTEIDRNDGDLPAVYRLYAYFKYNGKHYRTAFQIPDVYTKEETKAQFSSLIFDEQAFSDSLRKYVAESIRIDNTISAIAYKLNIRKPLFVYELAV